MKILPPISLHVGWVDPKRNPSLLMRFVPQRILCIKLIGGKIIIVIIILDCQVILKKFLLTVQRIFI